MMRRAKLVVGLVLVAVVGLALWTWQPQPELPADLADLDREYDVRILRDTWGAPHIFGSTDADVAHGLAWAHAEDDFATIQGALLAARGELAAVYGRGMAANDYMFHLLRIGDVVADQYPRLDASTRDLCQAYAEGLNLYAARHPKAAVARLYPVHGADVVAGFVHKLPLFFGLDGALRELFEDQRQREVSDVDGGQTQLAAWQSSWLGPILGSNAFAVAPSRSADQHTRLAINSHQPWQGPVAWYEAHLHSDEGWDMVGGVFPGAPLILHGHNRHLGWAHTVNQPDLFDVYVLDIDAENPQRYRFDGEWRELESRKARFEVRLFGPFAWTVEREVLWSVYGPVVERPHGTYALRFSGMGDGRHIEQWYRMNKAQDFGEWQAAMAMQAIPMFNTVYADHTGEIFYVYNASLPIRQAGYDWKEYVPAGWSQSLWRDYLPYDQLPQVRSPSSGFVQNCNNSPFATTTGEGNPMATTYAREFGIETRMTNRSLRLLELLEANSAITAEEFESYKFDIAYAEDSWLRQLVQRLRELPDPDDELLRRAVEVLAKWDAEPDLQDQQSALVLLALGEFWDTGPPPTDEQLLASLRQAAEHLDATYGGLEVAWGEVNRLRRGDVDLPLAGGPDTLHAVYGELAEDGRLRGVAGDSYILMVDWSPAGQVRSQSIHQFGSATLDEESPHYADQAALFAQRQLKPVWLDEADIRANLVREYRPGEK